MIHEIVKKYKQDGIRGLFIGFWDTVYFRVNDRCSGFAFRFLVQMYWLPFLTVLRKSKVGYELVDLRNSEGSHSPQLK